MEFLILNDGPDQEEPGRAGMVVEPGRALALQPYENPTIGQQRFQNIGKNSVSSIVGGYKAAVTKHANRLGFELIWQTRFYDHIIRDQRAFDTISQYIIRNPEKWNEDKFYDK